VILPVPTVADLREVARTFTAMGDVDRTWLRFVDLTHPAVDLGTPEHRTALLRWLNTWGCRIGYPKPGEPAPFDANVLDWWTGWAHRLPTAGLSLLADDDTDVLGEAYAELAAIPVRLAPRGRTLSATAAAKSMYALRPTGAMPWDAAIAVRLHGRRDAGAFAAHLRMGRDWALAVIAEAGVAEADVPALVGRPGISLAKVLDEYCYLRITKNA
jgi:hypothetical protein